MSRNLTYGCRYGWHFPELAKIVPDNFQYAKIVILAKDKMNITEEMQPALQEIVGDEVVAEQACLALRASKCLTVSCNDVAACEACRADC